MNLNEFCKRVAPLYLTLKNKRGAAVADKFLKDCFINHCMENEDEKLADIVLEYILNKYLELNVLGQIEEYINLNDINTEQIEKIVDLMEELI